MGEAIMALVLSLCFLVLLGAGVATFVLFVKWLVKPR